MRNMRFTLIELMLTGAISMGILASLSTLLYLSSQQAREHLTVARDHRQIFKLREAWRAHPQTPESIQVQDGQLILGDRQLPLPTGATLAVERSDGQAILVIQWPARRLKQPAQRTVRIVAALPEEAP